MSEGDSACTISCVSLSSAGCLRRAPASKARIGTPESGCISMNEPFVKPRVAMIPDGAAGFPGNASDFLILRRL